MKVSAPLSIVLLAAGCGPSHHTPTGPAAAPDAAPADEPAVGALARASELLAGDWSVAGDDIPVVFLHPHGGLSAVYGVAATSVPVMWMVDDAPDEAAVADRHLRVFQYRGDSVRVCDEKVEGGEGITFGCEEGAGGLHFLANGAALDVEEWTAQDGPDTTHLVEANASPAPACEDADRAFEADTKARGAAGWAAAYADDGVEWHGDQELKGKEAIQADITQTLEGGSLTWAPTVSRMLAVDGLCVTSGVWTFRGNAEKGGDPVHGTYLTVWRKDAGGWKVIFDGGRADR